MKNLANGISISRIVLSIGMLFTALYSMPFYAVYTLCGVTDVADGLVARITKTKSELGARLDSSADVVFIAIVLLMSITKYFEIMSGWMITVTVTVPIIKVASYIIGWIRFGRFTPLHTYLNKLTGILLFFSLFFLRSLKFCIPYLAVCCIAALLAAIEDCVVMLRVKKYHPNIRSIFKMNKKYTQKTREEKV